MKAYNIWLFCILVTLWGTNDYLSDIRQELRTQNQLLRDQAARAAQKPLPPAVAAWLKPSKPGMPHSLAEAMLDYYRRYHPEQLPPDAR